MRIWIQLPSQRPSNVIAPQAYLDLIEKIKRPDTEVSFHVMPLGPCIPGFGGFAYQGMRFLNDREILRAMSRAQSEGYDAVFVADWFDCALRAARQILSIPVVGVAEASMVQASMMGLRFAVVTADPRYVAEMTELIRLYGMSSRAIESRPVRAVRLNEQEFLGCISSDIDSLIQAFTASAKEAIAEGADTIISGCGLMASFLSRAGIKEIMGVPVIDPIFAGLKMAELLVDLKKAGLPAVSRRGYFEEIPAQMLEQATASGLF